MSQALFPSQLRSIRKARRNLPKIELVQAYYPSHFHPERKPSQVPKDTNKQTHTHTQEVNSAKAAGQRGLRFEVSRDVPEELRTVFPIVRGSNGAMEYLQDGQRLQNMPDGRRCRARGFDDSAVENRENGMVSISFI